MMIGGGSNNAGVQHVWEFEIVHEDTHASNFVFEVNSGVVIATKHLVLGRIFFLGRVHDLEFERCAGLDFRVTGGCVQTRTCHDAI